jgi:hypothetical protein
MKQQAQNGLIPNYRVSQYSQEVALEHVNWMVSISLHFLLIYRRRSCAMGLGTGMFLDKLF